MTLDSCVSYLGTLCKELGGGEAIFMLRSYSRETLFLLDPNKFNIDYYKIAIGAIFYKRFSK